MHPTIQILTVIAFAAIFVAVAALPVWAVAVPPRRKLRLTIGAWMCWTAALAVVLAATRSEIPLLWWAAILVGFALPILFARFHVRPGWDDNIIIGWWLLVIAAGIIQYFLFVFYLHE